MQEVLDEQVSTFTRLQVQNSNLPPKPVAKPTVPSDPSISTQNEPSTLMPQLVLDALYFSQRDIGVDIDVSMSLQEVSELSLRDVSVLTYQ